MKITTEKNAIRRMVEFAYLHCWGAEGGYESRQKFKRASAQIERLLGAWFQWDAKKFRWSKRKRVKETA